jgi:hypothetical protein
MFKQLIAAGGIGICQIDACRVAGVNENIAILLLASKFGVPVCPHACGVGLCEVVQHLSMFDYIAVRAARPRVAGSNSSITCMSTSSSRLRLAGEAISFRNRPVRAPK